METNEAERTHWNDARWTAVWPKRERLTTEVTVYVLRAAALQPGERVLDIGCGGGGTSLAAAAAVGPDGAVVGADVSVPLLGLAGGRAADAGVRHAQFHVVDMQLDPVPGAPFDVAISQFGVMFFDEPTVAFANIRAQLVPGGRIAFACWQEREKNPWIIYGLVAEFVPPPPPPPPGKSPTGPFSLSDAARTTGILEAAGFVDVRRTTYEISVETPPDTVRDDDQLTVLGVPDGNLAEAQARVDARMAQFVVSPGISRFPLAFQVFEARVG
ncbi:MAG: methyltransferase domain-containing protein [Gaiellales bacterium]